jgi:hypothetical protein
MVVEVLALGCEGVGIAHRFLHGRPTLPSVHLIRELRESLHRHMEQLRYHLRQPDSQNISILSAKLLAALEAYLEGNMLHRYLHQRAWPVQKGQLRIHQDDALLSDVEQAYLLLLQASLHPAVDMETKGSAHYAANNLYRAMETLGIVPNHDHGAMGYLMFAAGLKSTGMDVMKIVLSIECFENCLQEQHAEQSRAEDFAVALIAQHLWEKGYYYWSLEILAGIEFATRELPLSRYIRSLVHTSLQRHNASMVPADQTQIQALAAEDAVWADSPELYWSEK